MTPWKAAWTESLELGCTREEIFWHMIGPDTASTVDPYIVEWRSDDFPPAVGTLNHLRAKGPLGITARFTSRFTEFDPPKRMVVQGVAPPLARWGRQVHDLEDIPGGMRYTVTWETAPPLGLRTLYRLMSRRVRGGVVRGSRGLLERFGPPAP